ncbi:hypothetical protein [Lacinutrix himadriensis]|uniref:hypothetical protein n=1 Tax=Lacinutrix himadriensis TaxID=641549 RepID=UPI0006E2E9CB|nr:hypothetical protein [Lacinutrix himadriensis]
MPELSNIQTYEKLIGNDYKPTLKKFTKVLKQIGVWNAEIKKDFDSLKWKIEDNGFVFFSNSDYGFYKTTFSEIKVRPLIMAWTPAIDKTFKENWISCDLLIESQTINDYKNGKYKDFVFSLVTRLVKEMAKEFNQTGIYFTDEAQDGEDFDGIRTTDKNKLWNFDYALIPNKLKELYGEKPNNYNIKETANWIESWNLENWN